MIEKYYHSAKYVLSQRRRPIVHFGPNFNMILAFFSKISFSTRKFILSITFLQISIFEQLLWAWFSSFATFLLAKVLREGNRALKHGIRLLHRWFLHSKWNRYPSIPFDTRKIGHFSPSLLQLNKHETAPNSFQLCQNLTSDCLLIQLNFPIFTSSCMM